METFRFERGTRARRLAFEDAVGELQVEDLTTRALLSLDLRAGVGDIILVAVTFFCCL